MASTSICSTIGRRPSESGSRRRSATNRARQRNGAEQSSAPRIIVRRTAHDSRYSTMAAAAAPRIPRPDPAGALRAHCCPCPGCPSRSFRCSSRRRCRSCWPRALPIWLCCPDDDPRRPAESVVLPCPCRPEFSRGALASEARSMQARGAKERRAAQRTVWNGTDAQRRGRQIVVPVPTSAAVRVTRGDPPRSKRRSPCTR